MTDVAKLSFKYCIVPCCSNTTANGAGKLFFSVPKDPAKRKTWVKAIKRDERRNPKLSNKSSLYCCEDHFSLKDDMRNYWQWNLTRSVKRYELKAGVVPHVFDCQRKRVTPPVVRKAAQKRNRMFLVQEALSSALVPSTSSTQGDNPGTTSTKCEQVNLFEKAKEFLKSKRNAVAAAAAASEEPLKFEPNVIIKEELLDPDEESDRPQISSASTFPEFILPDPKKEWSSTDAKPCDLGFKPTVELTFCVEDESSPKASTSATGDEPQTAVTTPLCKVPESLPNGRTSSRKRSFSLPKDREAFPDKKRKGSQDEQTSEAGSAPDSEGMVERPRDHLDAYGEYIAAKLRLLDWKSCAYVQKAISDILFEAEIKKSTNEPPSNRSLWFEHDKSIAGRCPLPNLR